MLILFFSFKIKFLDSLLCVSFIPRILLGINVFFSFYVFGLCVINFYVSPFIGLVLILDYISVRIGVFFLIGNHLRFC